MSSIPSKTCLFRCALMNDLFSQSLADRLHGGLESEDNVKYQWEDEMMIQNVIDIKLNTSATYLLKGTQSDESMFSHAIPEMTVFQLTLQDNTTVELVVSPKLIASLNQSESKDVHEIVVELKDNEPFINPISGVYITHHDIPNELKNH